MNNQQEQAKPEPPKKYGLEDFNIYKVLGKIFMKNLIKISDIIILIKLKLR